MSVLKVPTRNISNNHPTAIFRNFVDDRSWSATTAFESAQIMREWNSWSDTMGLVESSKKTQFFAATAKHRRNLLLKGIREEHVTKAPCLLGSVFKGRKHRKNVPKEDDRLQKSMQLVLRAAFLPVEIARKRAIIAATPIAEAEFGWLFKLPTRKQISDFGICIRRALGEPVCACVHLRSILRGHRLDLDYRILETNVLAAKRCADKLPDGQPCEWNTASGWPANINTSLQLQGWSRCPRQSWTWRHDGLANPFTLQEITHVPR